MTDRQREILEILKTNSGISVSELAGIFGVSSVTIRSDLDALERDALVVRTRGGALPAFHPRILSQAAHNLDAKSKIARAAAEMIRDGDCIIIGTGTTTALIGKFLLGRRDIHIVTNNTLLLTYARTNPQLRLTLLGGEFRSSEEGVVGPLALRELEQFHVAKAFVGADGISLKQGFTANFLESAEFVRKIAEQADKIHLLADQEKFGQSGFARILPFDGVDMLICDRGISNEYREALGRAGVEIHEV